MTLTSRLLVFFLSILALVLVGFSTTIYLLANNYLHRQADERLDAVLNTLSAAIESGPEHVEWEPQVRLLKLDVFAIGEQAVWIVANDHGRIVDRSRNKLMDQFLADTSPSFQHEAAALDDHKWEGKLWKAGQRWVHAGSYEENNSEEHGAEEIADEGKHTALSVTAGVALGALNATLLQLATSLVAVSLVIWIVAFVAGRFVCRRALLPVTRMATAAQEMDANDLDQRLPPTSTKDELETLNLAFNNRLDRLQVAFERQKSFTGDASHQLRTPLTAILGQVEVALRRERTADEYHQVLYKVQKKATHLTRMVESLLFLARANTEAQLPELEPVELREWLPQHLETWSEHARADDIALKCVGAFTSRIAAQPALLGELLNILLDNACKYSELGTPIQVRLEHVANTVTVHVQDQGYGIDESAIANLYLPFFRSKEARLRGVDGVGLGLSIANRLVEVLGCELSVKSEVGRGACFTLRFASAD
jgi:heavy metal sensor kinase